jgi:hypothetical protein
MKDGMDILLADLFYAQEEFKKCQVDVVMRLNRRMTSQECIEFVNLSDLRIKDPYTGTVYPDELQAKIPKKRVAPPSWTLNEKLDRENEKVFKKFKVVHEID